MRHASPRKTTCALSPDFTSVPLRSHQFTSHTISDQQQSFDVIYFVIMAAQPPPPSRTGSAGPPSAGGMGTPQASTPGGAQSQNLNQIVSRSFPFYD